jgi:glycosyltransferase involved in cell wall biosynthesis
MRVLLVSKYLYPRGGDVLYASRLAEVLKSHGHEVDWWGMSSPNDPPYEHSDLFVPFVDLDAPQKGLRKTLKAAANILYSFDAKRRVEEMVRRTKPDVAHVNNFAHQLSPSILHVFRKHRIPVVMTMHDYKPVCASYRMLARGKPCMRCKGGRHYHCAVERCVKGSLVKSVLSAAEMYLHHTLLGIYHLIDVFISPSKFMMDVTREMGLRGRIVHLPNFLPVEQYEPRFGSDSNNLLYFGRLSSEKGLSTLIKAMRELPDVMLQIAGAGPEEEALRQQARTQGASNITFLGHNRGAELSAIIGAASCTVVPSEWLENYPYSIVESLALGKPVVGARIGGIPELVLDGETGYTFEPGDPADLARKIKLLLADNDLRIRLGKNGRALIERVGDAETYYNKLMPIYQGLVHGANLEPLTQPCFAPDVTG